MERILTSVIGEFESFVDDLAIVSVRDLNNDEREIDFAKIHWDESP
jgi:hypothetical protein